MKTKKYSIDQLRKAYGAGFYDGDSNKGENLESLFMRLTEIDPELGSLKKTVESYVEVRRYYENPINGAPKLLDNDYFWYSCIKPILTRIVGLCSNSVKHELKSSFCYDISYNYLISILEK